MTSPSVSSAISPSASHTYGPRALAALVFLNGDGWSALASCYESFHHEDEAVTVTADSFAAFAEKRCGSVAHARALAPRRGASHTTLRRYEAISRTPSSKTSISSVVLNTCGLARTVPGRCARA